MRRFFRYTFLWLWLLTACSGQPNPTSASISATLDEYRITPSEWRVPASQDITLKLSNIGKQAHTWVLLKDSPTEPFSADDEAGVLFQSSLQAGTSQTITFKSPAAPGEYSVTSSLPGDLEGGMFAKIVVVQSGY